MTTIWRVRLDHEPAGFHHQAFNERKDAIARARELHASGLSGRVIVESAGNSALLRRYATPLEFTSGEKFPSLPEGWGDKE